MEHDCALWPNGECPEVSFGEFDISAKTRLKTEVTGTFVLDTLSSEGGT